MGYTSSDKALEVLIAGQITPQELDNYEEDEDIRSLLAIYESSSIDIIGKMNTEDFYSVYNVLKGDIMMVSDALKRDFISKYLDEMSEVYEFEFAIKPKYDTSQTIEQMFKFIEFVEYDNITFLSYVWSYLDPIERVNIPKYVKENEKTIIEEITNQIDLMVTLTENVSDFLRTYNKEGLIEWFINRSEKNKYEIFSRNM